MEERLIKVGITQGDINGIGYEIILKTLSDNRIAELCTPVIYGSSKLAAYHRKALGLPPLNISSIGRAEEAGTNRVNIINCVQEETKIELTKSTEIAGEAALKSLEAAVADLKRGIIDVLLTAPVNKDNISTPAHAFSGHAAYLEEQFDADGQSLSMLINDELRIAFATGYIPFAQVAESLTTETITNKLEIFNRSLLQDFNIVKPRIAVLSLNPSDSDAGLAGDEEERIIAPAMAEAEKKGVMSFGPYAADDFFGSSNYDQFDGVLAMYHDQGAIPFRTLTMEEGFHYTAGLPVVRTAPANGTSYEIAGQNVASEDSFRHALYAALDIFRNRQLYTDATRNPLRKQYFDKGTVDEKLDLTKDEEEETL